MIAETYQEEQSLEEKPTSEYSFATIGQVYNDGISLIFPGSEKPSEKHYRANLYCKFSAGQRVYLVKDSGTYVVLFPVGIPGSITVRSDTAASAATADKANTAASAATADKANTAASAATADKWKTSKTITLSGDVTGSGSIDGSSNVTIKTTLKSSGTNSVKYFTERHTGSTLAFFNQSARSRIFISKITGTATTSTIQNKVNEIITGLISYGLFK